MEIAVVGYLVDHCPRLNVGCWRSMVVQKEGTEEKKGTYEEIRK